MAIEEITYYRCSCDKCGTILESFGEQNEFNNIKELMKEMAFSGWKIVEIHNTYKTFFLCPNCAGSDTLPIFLK